MSGPVEVVDQWLYAKKCAEYWQAKERELRDFIVRQAFNGHTQVAPTMPDGTHRLPLPDGRKVKVALSTTKEVKFGKELATFLEWIEHPQARFTDSKGGIVSGADMRDDVLYRRLSLRKKGFDAAPEPVKRMLLPAVVTKPDAPQLTIEESN